MLKGLQPLTEALTQLASTTLHGLPATSKTRKGLGANTYHLEPCHRGTDLVVCRY